MGYRKAQVERSVDFLVGVELRVLDASQCRGGRLNEDEAIVDVFTSLKPQGGYPAIRRTIEKLIKAGKIRREDGELVFESRIERFEGRRVPLAATENYAAVPRVRLSVRPRVLDFVDQIDSMTLDEACSELVPLVEDVAHALRVARVWFELLAVPEFRVVYDAHEDPLIRAGWVRTWLESSALRESFTGRPTLDDPEARPSMLGACPLCGHGFWSSCPYLRGGSRHHWVDRSECADLRSVGQ